MNRHNQRSRSATDERPLQQDQKAAQSAANSSATRAKSGRTRRPAGRHRDQEQGEGRQEEKIARRIVRYPLVAMMTLMA